MEFMSLGLLLLFIIALLIIIGVAFFFWGLKYAIALGINGVIGFFALYAMQAVFQMDIVINVWSILLVAIGGIIGFGLVLVLHGIGLWF